MKQSTVDKDFLWWDFWQTAGEVRCWSVKTAQYDWNPPTMKSTVSVRPNFKSLHRYLSPAAYCSISLYFGKEFDHITADTLQIFKVKWSKVKVTA